MRTKMQVAIMKRKPLWVLTVFAVVMCTLSMAAQADPLDSAVTSISSAVEG